MENVFVELMKIASIAKPLRDDVLEQWTEYSSQKQYLCGLLGQLLLDKTLSIAETHRGIYSDSDLVMVERFNDARIPLGKDQQNILGLMDSTDWPPGFEEEWTRTNNLKLCQDIALLSCGCVETVLQQLKLEQVQGIDYSKPKYTHSQLCGIIFDIIYPKYFKIPDLEGKYIKPKPTDFDYDSLSDKEQYLFEKIYDDVDEYFKELYEKETGEKYE